MTVEVPPRALRTPLSKQTCQQSCENPKVSNSNACPRHVGAPLLRAANVCDDLVQCTGGGDGDAVGGVGGGDGGGGVG